MFKFGSPIFLYLLVSLSSPVFALSSGLINDFQSSTTEGWIHPRTNANQPRVESANNNHFLVLSAKGGFGSGSRLLGINKSAPWNGQVDSDVTGISMDLSLPPLPSEVPIVTDFELSVRIAVATGSGANMTWYASTTPHTLQYTVTESIIGAAFPFNDLVQVSGSAELTDVLNNITEVRILHATSPNFRGDAILAEFRVDNIRATSAEKSPIPVPAFALILLASIFASLSWYKHRA